MTETILTKYITYLANSTVDTVVTQKQTVNQTKTVFASGSQPITHSTPTFNFIPTPGVTLTFTAGSTYVIYSDLYGGLNTLVEDGDPKQHSPSCASPASTLLNWEPTATADWSYFVQTYTTNPPVRTTVGAVPLPSNLIGFLKQEPSVIANFSGSDIATCTQAPKGNLLSLFPDPHRTIPDALTMAPSRVTGTFLSTTYASTSTHVTVAGCLRCQNTDPTTGPTAVDQPSGTVTADSQPTQPPPDQSVTIGTRVFPISNGPGQQQTDTPDGQNQSPSVVVIGSQTLTPGQTTTIEGVTVVVPPNAGGSSLVIGGSTIAISPAGPTGPPVITVESNPVTANSQGQFIIGSQTLTPGGPAITDNGNTYSLAPSGSVAVINGVTTSLANAPAPTPAPVLVVNGQTVPAFVDKGTTQFVLGPGQTLTPGGVLAISGTTYSMPASGSGSVVVINGATSTLSGPVITGAPALTINGNIYAAAVVDGTTQYVLGAGTTLKPGDAVTISGTTYSLDSKGTALVINGQTSTIPRTPASNSASVTQSSSSMVSSTSSRDTGDKIASGIGQTGKKSTAGAARSMQTLGFDKWVEGLVIGAAGWLLMWL